jgi:hypothetical protein
VEEVALSQVFLPIFRFFLSVPIPSMLHGHSSLTLGLTVSPLEATAPQRHCLNSARDLKRFRRYKMLSLIIEYCGFEEGMRFWVMIDAKVPSMFVTTGTLVNVPMEKCQYFNLITTYECCKKEEHSCILRI